MTNVVHEARTTTNNNDDNTTKTSAVTTRSRATLQDQGVAIVGAGFAGLTLANVLQQQGTPFHLLEAKDGFASVQGWIDLPHAHEILRELNLLLHEDETLANTTTKPSGRVRQEAFLHALRTRIQGSICYSTRVVELKREILKSPANISPSKDLKDHNKSLCLLKVEGKDSRTGTKRDNWLGPFSTLVAANGLFGSHLVETDNLYDHETLRCFLVGDARWQYDVPLWDFGSRRRKCGGDLAIRDGLELGKWLAKDYAYVNQKSNHNDNDNDKNDLTTKTEWEAYAQRIAQKFDSRPTWLSRTWRRMNIPMPISVAIAVWLWLWIVILTRWNYSYNAATEAAQVDL